jgi:hypothetical protein
MLGSARRQARASDAGVVTAETTAWLRAWDAHGYHRTGTDGDEAGAAWLERYATSLGAVVSSESFALDRIDPMTTWLDVGGTRIEGVPVFDAPATGDTAIEGPLGPVGSDAIIGVVELSPHAVYTGEYQALCGTTQHRALVVVCQGQHPGMGLLNAEQFSRPYGAPAIHVASEARDAVLAAATRRDVARLMSHYRRTTASGRNVVVTLAGRDRARPPLVVMTPRSSWWQSTAERGGGLVCWLEALRALNHHAPPTGDVVLTANSGHELGHLGLDAFIARRRGWEREATWLHLGANLGAFGSRLTVMSTSDDLRSLTARELASAGQPPDVLAPKTQVPSGETRDIHRANGRYLTLVGSNPWFHLPTDRWPHSIDVGAVARIASAATRIAVALAR